jgi:site-specific recombinase XerD
MIEDYFNGRLRSKHTFEAYNRVIKEFFLWSNNGDVNQATTEAYIEYLKKKGLSPSTLNVAACALKKYGEIHGNYFKVTNIPAIDQKVPDILSEDEVRALIDGIKDIRDKAIVALLYDCALRVGELVNLNYSDVDMENRLLILEHRKKNRAPQAVPFSKKSKEILERYFEEREKRGFSKKIYPELFVGGVNGRLSVAGIRYNLKRYGQRILGKPVHPHQLRHSRASHLRDKGMSLDLLREFLGHRRVDTTLIYARLSPSELKSKLEELEEE